MRDELSFYKGFVVVWAKEFGWKPTFYKKDRELMAFKNAAGRCHLEVYLRSKRVITCLQHPKGTSILERSGVGISELKKIFEDPRVHTTKGKKI